MNKEEVIKLINQQIKIALKKFKQELEQGMKVKKISDNKGGGVVKFTSLQEFINEKNPRKAASEAMPVLAYYLREIDKRKLNELDEKIMKAMYKRIDRSRPKRIIQAFVDSSHFDKVPNKLGVYKLNDDGDYFVEVTLEERKGKTLEK